MKSFKFFLLLIVTLALTLAFVGCNGCDPEQENAKVTLDKTELTLTLGESATIKAQTLTKGATVEWASSNSAICSVEKGVLSTHALGIVEITATCEGETASCMVEVIAPVSGNMQGYTLNLNRNSVTLCLSETFLVVPELKNVNGQSESATFSYLSLNPSVATVDGSGKITAIAIGQTSIEVKYQNGDNWISTLIQVNVEHDYKVVISPFGEDVNQGDKLDIVYEVYKDGVLVDYPQENVSVYLSNNEVASIENGKIEGKEVGITELTVLLTDVNVKGSYEFAVIPLNPTPINLSIDDIEMYVGATVDVNVEGASWGHFGYKVSNNDFSVENGKITAKTESETTLTVTHLETKKSITATVRSNLFNPCITTAEQFLDINYALSDCYLDADIDLSGAEWKSKTGFSTIFMSSPNSEVAYLVEKLNVSLDGRGHKITVRYDHDIAGESLVGGIFYKTAGSNSNIVIKNLVVDFEAKYFGPGDSTGVAAMNSVITLDGYKTEVNDCFIGVRMYSDNNVNRETVIGNFNGGNMNNCIFDIAVYKNNVFQSGVGTPTWHGKNNTVKNSTIIHNGGAEYSSGLTNGSYYSKLSNFITAWKVNELVNQSTYTAWSVENDKLHLNGREVVVNLAEVNWTDPCITTAEQFLALDKATGPMYLGADIDLTDAVWKTKTGFSLTGLMTDTTSTVAYLVDSLNFNLDGRGHKVTVRYDHDIAGNALVGGIFYQISGTSSNIVIKNLVVDFEAKYVGPNHGTAMNSVITLVGYKASLESCYIKARMYADDSVNRETVIGNFNGGTVNNCVFDMAVYLDDVFQHGKGTALWHGKNSFVQNSTLIYNSTQAFTGAFTNGSYYKSFTDFITAWNQNALVNQSTYTAWSVLNGELYLSDRKVTF